MPVNALDKALTDAKAINPATVKPLLAAFMERATLDDDGTIRGLADEIGKLAKTEGTIMDAGSDLSALIADELWSLVGANSNPLAAGFVQEMVKTIRGLGDIAITSTQGMQDLFGLDGGKYGKGILDSSRIKLVMQMEEQEARLIQGVLNLSEDEVRQITRFRRGEGLLCIGYILFPN